MFARAGPFLFACTFVAAGIAVDSFRRLRFALFAGPAEVVKQPLNRLDARVRCLPALDLGNGVEWHTADLRDFFQIAQAASIQVGHEC